MDSEEGGGAGEGEEGRREARRAVVAEEEDVGDLPLLEGEACDAEEPDGARAEEERTRREKSLGLVLVVLVAVIWVASGALIQYIFDDLSFDSPFFLTYANNSLFALYLLSYRARVWWRARSGLAAPGGSMPARETVRAALVLCPIWFALNYTFNLSLDMTSIASNTILSSTSGLWTLLLSWPALGETPTLANGAGVLLTVAGATVVSLRDFGDGDGDGGSDGHTGWGDVLCLLSAVFYGLYTVTLKRKVSDDRAADMQLLFGALGTFNALFFWPGFLLLNYTGGEVFELPSARAGGFLLLNGLVGTVLSDFLWARSVLLVGPLVATLGLALTVPLSMVADLLLHHARFSVPYLLGSLMVVCGFVLVNVAAPAPGAETKPARQGSRPGRRRELLSVVDSAG